MKCSRYLREKSAFTTRRQRVSLLSIRSMKATQSKDFDPNKIKEISLHLQKLQKTFGTIKMTKSLNLILKLLLITTLLKILQTISTTSRPI